MKILPKFFFIILLHTFLFSHVKADVLSEKIMQKKVEPSLDINLEVEKIQAGKRNDCFTAPRSTCPSNQSPVMG